MMDDYKIMFDHLEKSLQKINNYDLSKIVRSVTDNIKLFNNMVKIYNIESNIWLPCHTILIDKIKILSNELSRLEEYKPLINEPLTDIIICKISMICGPLISAISCFYTIIFQLSYSDSGKKISLARTTSLVEYVCMERNILEMRSLINHVKGAKNGHLLKILIMYFETMLRFIPSDRNTLSNSLTQLLNMCIKLFIKTFTTYLVISESTKTLNELVDNLYANFLSTCQNIVIFTNQVKIYSQ